MIAALIFIALSALHVYWGLGGRWPGTDDGSLASKVYGASSTKMPSPAACFVVAALLAAAALIVLSASGFIVQLPLVHVGSWVIAVVFFARGFFGFFDRFLRPKTRGTDFERLNLVFYSPLCLALCALTYYSALRT